MKTKQLLITALMISLIAGIAGCDLVTHHTETALPGNAVIATSDYTAGALATLNIEAKTSSTGILQGVVGSDLRVRFYNGLIYVLNNSDMNITLVDPANKYALGMQESTGSSSYPHDLVFSHGKGYVALNGSSSIWVINPATLKKTAEIDLSKYTPAGASTPSIDQFWLDSTTGYLFVSVERFNADYTSIDSSTVVVIDTASDTVMTKDIPLSWTDSNGNTIQAKDPFGKFVYASRDSWDNGDGHDHLFILCAGLLDSSWNDLHDGGIIAIDIDDFTVESGFLVSETTLNSSISDFDYRNGTFYVASNGTSTSDLSAVKSGSSLKTNLKSIQGTYKIPFVKLNATGLLLIGDSSADAPGIWILDTATNTMTTTSAISTDLPPTDIALTE